MYLLFIIKRKTAISFVCLFNLLGQSIPITTVQDANSIRGMSRCTRYKFYVTNICKRLVVDGLFNNGPRWRTGHVWGFEKEASVLTFVAATMLLLFSKIYNRRLYGTERMVFSKHATYYIWLHCLTCHVITWQPPPPNSHIRHFGHANISGLTSTHTMENVQR